MPSSNSSINTSRVVLKKCVAREGIKCYGCSNTIEHGKYYRLVDGFAPVCVDCSSSRGGAVDIVNK